MSFNNAEVNLTNPNEGTAFSFCNKWCLVVGVVVRLLSLLKPV
ncbi:MAG TPA: hypothetical protein VGB45_09505 [Abditibacterium sp.]